MGVAHVGELVVAQFIGHDVDNIGPGSGPGRFTSKSNQQRGNEQDKRGSKK